MISLVTQWLPLLSSLIVAGVALGIGLLNDRTNRTAITAADERNRLTVEITNSAADKRNQETLKAAQRNIEQANQAAEHREHDKWRREAIPPGNAAPQQV